MMKSIPGVGGPGHVPQQPSEQPETDLNQTAATDLFNDLIQKLSSLISEAKLGGKSHG
ncbi:MAG: hypothetical protein QNJ27_04955 [Simkaniaceae bacterium]|nr:hypothetical protein [Simkaniaceae bacterium]